MNETISEKLKKESGSESDVLYFNFIFCCNGWDTGSVICFSLIITGS